MRGNMMKHVDCSLITGWFSHTFVNENFFCCFQTFIHNSYKKSGEVGHPFGYLKASSNLQTVNLFVMPYNFPVLFPVIGKKIECNLWSLKLLWTWNPYWYRMETFTFFTLIVLLKGLDISRQVKNLKKATKLLSL